MLKRIYVDNFRCLVNFELSLERLELFLGGNGAGKTSVFAVLRKIQDFVIHHQRVHELFLATELTRWQTLGQQCFELDIERDTDHYFYRLLIEHDADRRRMRVKEESLKHNNHPLFESQDGMAQLYRDDYSQGPQYPFDWTQSGVGSLTAISHNQKLTRFKEELGKLIVIQPMPPLMARESRGEDAWLQPRMENFISWYRHLAQEFMVGIAPYFDALKQAMPGFESIRLKESGEDSRLLKVQFTSPVKGSSLTYDFAELSDGQRMLLALYALSHGMQNEGISLFIDEPENFVALREIQPWLSSLADAMGDSLEQAVLISHHPEVINYLGVAHGRWFFRESEGPVRLMAPRHDEEIGLSEGIARGWIQ